MYRASRIELPAVQGVDASGTVIACQDPEGRYGRARGFKGGGCAVMQLPAFTGAPGIRVHVEALDLSAGFGCLVVTTWPVAQAADRALVPPAVSAQLRSEGRPKVPVVVDILWTR